MTIAECYEKLGGDYNEILGRLKRESTISKLALKFLDDESFKVLKSALCNNDINEAHRGAHTLKGICRNLSFNMLYQTSDNITQALKDGDIQQAQNLLSSVQADYDKTIDALNAFKSSLQ